MHQKVSIIIPAYNSEKTIKRCLNSIYNQKYTDYEIVVINDGSTDGTLSILEEYNLIYDNFILINKKNEGVSVARNLGIDRATGDYILFMDADDYIRDDYLDLLVSPLINNNCKIVISGYKVLNSTMILSDISSLEDNKGIVSKNVVLKLLVSSFKDRLYGYVWRCLFDSSLLKSIRFENNLKISEDFLFICQVVNSTDKVYLLPEEAYYYVCNPESVTANYIPSLYDDMVEINNIVFKEICENNPELYDGYYSCVANTYLRALQNTSRGLINEKDAVFKAIKKSKEMKKELNASWYLRKTMLHFNSLRLKDAISFLFLFLNLDFLYIFLFINKQRRIRK